MRSWRCLACGLTDVAVRDTLYALAVGAQGGRAGASLGPGVLSRTLPDRGRVEALAALAFSACSRDDGPLAGLSLEAALRSTQAPVAGMLDTALQSGMRPEQIRELAGTGPTGWPSVSASTCRRGERSAAGPVSAGQTFSTMAAWAISCGSSTFSWPPTTIVTSPSGLVCTSTRAFGTTPASLAARSGRRRPGRAR